VPGGGRGLAVRLQRSGAGGVGPARLRLRPLGRLAGRNLASPGVSQHRLDFAAPGPRRGNAARGRGRARRGEGWMILLHPVWLILAVPLLASFWIWPLPTWRLRCLRLAVLTLLLLALAGLAVRLPSRAGTVVVVADRSESMPGNAEVEQKRMIEEIQKQMGPDDRLAVVSFGRDVVVERPPTAGKFDGFLHHVRRDASNLAGALETALGLIPHDAPGRVLLLS